MKNILTILFAFLSLQASAQLKDCKEILSIKINEVKNHADVNSDDSRSVGLLSFNGYCDNEYFKGEIQPGAFDTQKNENGVATLSARYMLTGKDSKNNNCNIFIENNAVQGGPYSQPKIFTDSKALDFLNTSELVGHLDHSDGQFYVRIYVREPGNTTEDLWVQGTQGKLAATLEKPELKQGEKCPVVIICHGFGGQRSCPTTNAIAQQLSDNGIASIRFDFNGHGESEGRFEDMTVPNEIEDAKSIYQFVSSLPFADRERIAILGISQGGVVASMTAGELGHKKLAAAVLMCPAAVLRDDCIKGNTMGQFYNPLDPPERLELGYGRALGREFIKTAFSLPIYETAERYHGKGCIIHGTGDRVAPYTYGIRFHDIWPGSEYHQLEGYDHGFNPNPLDAVAIAVDYLKRNLADN